MPYSLPGDLLIGDLSLNGVDVGRYIQGASNEMDAKLGVLYDLPLHLPNESATADSWKSLRKNEQLLLSDINNKLASGRLIMSLAAAGEDAGVHAYGASLVKEAREALLVLANGDLILTAAPETNRSADATSSAPVILHEDSESLLLGFENTVMRGQPWYSRPGVVP